MFDEKDLLEATHATMPFGKYKGRKLIHIPEEYFLWFREKGFPEGKLGMHMAIILEAKVNGLQDVLNNLSNMETK